MNTPPRLISVLPLLAAVACIQTVSADDVEPQRGGTAIAVITGDPVVLNPNLTTLIGDQFLGCLIYDGLVENKSDGSSTPALAKSWTISPDNLTYTFQLQTADWQDGTPFTADDVKYTLEQVSLKFSPIFSTGGKLITSIDVSGDHQVAIHLSQPYGPFLHSLACDSGGAILPAHLFRGKGDVATNPASITAPVGTGPFKLAEWKRGDYLRFSKNPRYWSEGKPYLDEIIAKIIPQAASRVQALRSGDVDFINSSMIPDSDRAAIENSRALKQVAGSLPASQSMMFMNQQNKYLVNAAVRKALMRATDRDYLVNKILGGRATATVGPFTSRIPWAFDAATDYTTLYPFNVKDAERQLDEAGFTKNADGQRFELKLAYDAGNADSARLVQAVQGMWRNIGVSLVLQPMDRPTISKSVFVDRNFDMVYWTYGSYGDPGSGLARIYQSASIGKVFGNPSGYSRPEVDEALGNAASLVELNERGVEYAKASALIAEDLPVLVLTSTIAYDAASKKLNGVWDGTLGYGKWSNAWLAK